MRSLSDTIERLAAFRSRQNMQVPAAVDDRLRDFPEFGSNPGALRARIYVPPSHGQNAPLVVVLHGCTQTAAAYDHGAGWSQLADREGFVLLYPEQQRANNPNLCFNWFLPGDIQRGAGEALSIAQMIEAVVATYGIARKRIFITGLSAGGAMTSVMLATYPELFAGGAIIAGLPYRCASTVPEAFDRMRGHGGPSQSELQSLLRDASSYNGPWPKLSIWQGTADRTVAPSNADAIIGQWLGVHGLSQSPSRTSVVDGHSRRVWLDADGGEVIEEYLIAGMGHGTPLSTRGADGVGAAGPFMLEKGISSTLQIARFWGFALAGRRPEAESARDPASVPEMVPTAAPMSEPAMVVELTFHLPKNNRTPEANARPAKGVRTIIENALRAAGLMS
jgi:poly(hydroxyalkanoate) depolymerase family esterase